MYVYVNGGQFLALWNKWSLYFQTVHVMCIAFLSPEWCETIFFTNFVEWVFLPVQIEAEE